MRAAVLRGGRLEVRETDDPVPGPGELLLRTLSTAVCASDIHYMDHPDPGDRSGMFVWDTDRDVVMGHEFVGEVVAHGPGCSDRFPLGARVTSIPTLLRAEGRQVIGQHPDAPGSFGEQLVVSEVLARAVPYDADLDSVALTDAFAVGEGYVALSGITSGQIPLVIGAGAIGLSAVAALAARGIEPIVVADLNPGRLELAARFGAHVTVDASERSPHDVWNELAGQRAVTEPPTIFECVGAAGLLQRIVEECTSGSRIYAAGGWYTGDALDVTLATKKLVMIQFGGAPRAEDWYGTLDAIVSGRLDPRPSIGLVVGLDGVPEAIALARRAQGPPRIVVHPTE
ncbi:MAG TPA: zinc-binding dehydrogenase [Acidimicrobiia bacterium]|jgi:threonine dehydrogenase-like Zn-dependent dehydrogenase